LVLTPANSAATRPLSVLLSQVLVAFTVEFDNEFERRMGEAGYPGARLSLVVWANLLQFVGESGLSVRELGVKSFAPGGRVQFQLGCLERWRFVVLQSGPERRPGWGSGRGMRADWIVRLTPRGLAASRIWPPLFGEIERRWETRFGREEIGRLREALQVVADQLDVELPDGLPGNGEGPEEFPPRVGRARGGLPLPTLLSHLLLTFRLDFERESALPLELCANTLRVLGETPVRAAELPRLTGTSPETSDIGWQLKPYVVVAPDPARSRGKVVRLSPRGLSAQRIYHRLIRDIEQRWEKRFGRDAIAVLRESLQGLFGRLAEGLIPPQGTVRAGDQAPALGRRDVGVAARQRMRDLVAQTEAFLRDPQGTLPHYPAWDMNRGFGP
jgi:hypothetical protein